MNITNAFFEGLRRVMHTRLLWISLFVLTFIASLPVAAVMFRTLDQAMGSGFAQEGSRTGFDMDWFGEFQAGRQGIGTTFTPSIIGFGAVLNNIETFLDGSFFELYIGIVAAVLLYLLAWTFFAGGVISTYAEGRGFSREGFIQSSARYFVRFLQLLVLAGILYFLVFRYVGKPLFKGIENWTQDWTDERPVLFLNIGAYVVVLFLLTVISMAFDYAKIHTILEGRKNMIAAMLRGFGFVLNNPLKTFGLYYLVGTIACLVMLGYAAVAPGPGQSSTSTVIVAFLVGQAYLLARMGVKLLFLSSQTVMMASHRPLPQEEPVIA